LFRHFHAGDLCRYPRVGSSRYHERQ
jgi:hypothetical protein